MIKKCKNCNESDCVYREKFFSEGFKLASNSVALVAARATKAEKAWEEAIAELSKLSYMYDELIKTNKNLEETCQKLQCELDKVKNKAPSSSG